MGTYGEKQRNTEPFHFTQKNNSLESVNNEIIFTNKSFSLKDFFLDWIAGRHAGYSVTALIECLDKTSMYIRKREICTVDLWSISQYTEFKTLYNILMDDEEFCTIDMDTYNILIKAGELYLKFLEDKGKIIRKKLNYNLKMDTKAAKKALQRRATNYFYTYKLNGEVIIDAISVPSIHALHFNIVKRELIIPYLNSTGISEYTDLTFERAKNAKDITPVPAHTIAPVISINGVNYDTLTGTVIADSPNENAQTFPVSLSQEIVEPSSLPVTVKMEQTVTVPSHASQKAIDPEALIAWLVTQPNANGTFYLENVARQYISALRSTPSKLNSSIALDAKSVFSCRTPEQLNAYWDICKTAPNYKQINDSTSGAFSAGMGCLLRYQQHLLGTPNTSIETKSDVIQLIKSHGLKYVDKRNLGGAIWIIGGRGLSPIVQELRDSGFSFTYKAGGGRSSNYRDAWWYHSSENENGRKAEEPEKAQPIYAGPNINSVPAQVDFSHPELCSQTRPLSCRINGQEVILSKQNWTQLLVAITERFIAEGNPHLESLDRKPIYGSKAFFMPSRPAWYSASLLSNGKWLLTDYNPQTIVTIIRNLCQHCQVELDDVIITYGPKDGATILSAQMYTLPDYVNPAVSPMTKLNAKVIEQITSVLSAHFKNGYRLNSPIELVRLKTFAEEDLGKKLTLADDELKSYIAACGTTYDSKVYAVPTQAKERIEKLVEEYFANGAQAIFYAELYAKNENWLFEASVVSEDMLVNILHRQFPKLLFTQTYFGYTLVSIFAVLESEILRTWDDDILLTYDQLAERLPYIPFERIKYALGQNGDFIWNSAETFSHISRIVITDEEKQAIRAATVRECNARGYVSITDLPLGEIGERNYELSVTAVHNAAYRICLSDKFDKKGKIITRKGDVFDAMTIIKEYCRTINKCSLDDLLNFEKELTGEVHRWIPMEAGNTVLIRIDKETYVADRYVHFNTDLTDDAIGLFVKGDYLPLKAFTTFGAFPDCGQTWNLFLLESYCRRFSRKFRFDTPSVNSRNVGVVIRKSCGMDYTEIMTDAVVSADIPLKDNAVGNFLFDSGYTGRSTNAKVREIINKAKDLRERKD